MLNFGLSLGRISAVTAALIQYLMSSVGTETDGTRYLDNTGSSGTTNDATSYGCQALWFDGTQNIDFWLDYVAGSEKVTNGTFNTDTDWIKGTGITIAGGVADFTSVPNAEILKQTAISFEAMKTYVVSMDISNYTAGGVFIRQPVNMGSTICNSNGNHTVTFTVPEIFTDELHIRANDTTTLQIDNVSVKEVVSMTSSHAIVFNHNTAQYEQTALSGNPYYEFQPAAGSYSDMTFVDRELTSGELTYLSENPDNLRKIALGETDAGISLLKADLEKMYPLDDDNEGTATIVYDIIDQTWATSETIITPHANRWTNGDFLTKGPQDLAFKQDATGRITAVADANTIEITAQEYATTAWTPAAPYTVREVIWNGSTMEHRLLTYDGVTATKYVNDVSSSGTALAGAPLSLTNSNIVAPGTTTRRGEVLIENYVYSAAQITTDYNAMKTKYPTIP